MLKDFAIQIMFQAVILLPLFIIFSKTVLRTLVLGFVSTVLSVLILCPLFESLGINELISMLGASVSSLPEKLTIGSYCFIYSAVFSFFWAFVIFIYRSLQSIYRWGYKLTKAITTHYNNKVSANKSQD